MEFKKYQHVERYGTTEVEGIEIGTTFVFPKIDGTNSSVWLDNSGVVQCGSRNRQLTLDKDNAGFCAYINTQDNIKQCVIDNPNLRLYGEWLFPHAIKTYQDGAWRHFYVFDYIPPICVLENGTYDSYTDQLEKNVFLIQDGTGCGEGVVIKNYDYKNKFGQIKWAKIIASEFREKHKHKKGNAENSLQEKDLIETKIVNKYVTLALCEKVRAKIIEEKGEWNSKYIPMLLNMIYYDLLNEDCWHFVKENKFPTINFKTLMSLCYHKTKELLKL